MTERVLAIARDVFLERGIRATTAEVAKRAGISEGAIFHRFPTKDALFRAAMDFDPEVEPAFLTELPQQAGKGELRATLIDLGDKIIQIARVALPMMMMAWSNSASEYSLEKMAERKADKSKRVLNPLRAFFVAEKKLGRISPNADPDTLARVFLGSVQHLCMNETVFREDAERPSPNAYVRRVVDLLLDGAAAPTKKRGSKGTR